MAVVMISLDRTPRTFGGHPFPKIIAAAGEEARRRFLEFFTANIRNANTREVYARAVGQFCRWCERRGLSLGLLEPIIIAAYVEELGQRLARPTVKQHLAAIRMLFDYQVDAQGRLQWERKAELIAQEAQQDGWYLLHTNESVEQCMGEQVLGHYKGLLDMEEAFCELKSYLEVRPVHHRRPDRVINHVQQLQKLGLA